ncbi:MAG TPA: hypothetical protein PK264_15145, partial [Hyphomicrobiaceae bacterium]|nr:hypothetical protein [Hyphomicrobiaceae bacterium]
THLGYRMRICCLGGDIEGALEAMPRASDVPAFPGWKCALLAHADRLEEARLELKRFYHLAAANWAGVDAWSETGTVRWFLHAFPLRRRGDWERLRDGLSLAGAPVHGLRHRFWTH